MVQLPKELTSPLVSSVLKGAKKHRDSRILFLFVGLGIILVFLAAISLSPQIGDKLGKLSVKKQGQYANADIGNPGIVSLINQWRSQNGLGPVKEDQNLANAACWMANDMAAHNVSVLSHTDSLGRDPFQRMTAFGGYGNEWGGENLGAVFVSDSQAMFNAWQASPGHNANMLGSHYDRIGVGLAYSPTAPFRWYWVTGFASSSDSSHPFQALTSNCVSSQTPPPPQATAAFAPGPCLVISGTSCTSKVSWNISGYPSAYICYSNGVTQTYLGNGPSGAKNVTLPTGKKYTFTIRTPAGTTCTSGTTVFTKDVIWQNRGDADCSGVIDSVDALMILRFVARLSLTTKCGSNTINQIAADVDGDGSVTSVDANYVLQYVSTHSP